ncbi:uncharacterized protein LOC123904656 [Trifolium pratense]|uniref:uncharacterized protein LOC123904656 n=1 Tax=Trifolium pratense TaxID=57577 RepID=UPI001E697EB3|nr:uncharacterized protein LOC123904656 [Trifolium pratense]
MYGASVLELWVRNYSSGNNAPKFLAGLWWNWRARNIVCVGNELIHLFRVVAEVHKLATLIASCFPPRIHIDTPPRWTTWHSCRTSCMVLNVDGSCLGAPGRAGFGGLIRRGSGDWIVGFSGFLGVADNTYAELMIVLDLVTKGYSNFHCYDAVIANIQDLLKLDWEVSLLHTLREGNACTNFLTKLGSKNDTKLSIWDSPLEDMKDLLLSNALRVAYPRA